MTTEQRDNYQLIQHPKLGAPWYESARGLRAGLINRAVIAGVSPNITSEANLRVSAKLADVAEEREYLSGEIIASYPQYSERDLWIVKKGIVNMRIPEERFSIPIGTADLGTWFNTSTDFSYVENVAGSAESTRVLYLPADVISNLINEEQTIGKGLLELIEQENSAMKRVLSQRHLYRK